MPATHALHLALLLLSGADEIWTPYDRFSQPDDSCDVTAIVPGPAGSILLGSTCNRLDGAPTGPVVAVDLTGKALSTPFAKALATSLPDDRMREVSQLLAHGDGYVLTQMSRAGGARVTDSVHFPWGNFLTRVTAAGTRDEPFNAAVQAAFDERLGKRWGFLDVSADATGQLVVAAAQGSDDREYVKKTPARVLRFDAKGAVTAELKLDEALTAMGLGYYHVLMVRPRPDGGLFVGGRFMKPKPAPDPFYLLAFDAAWKPDAKFNGPFRKTLGAERNPLEIRLILPDDKGGAWVVGERNGAHVFHLTALGALDTTFKPYTFPGNYPQGRFLNPSLAARGAANALWVSFGKIPGKSPPWAAPGLVKLGASGTPDAALAKGLGKGFAHSVAAASEKDPDSAGWISAVAPLPDGSAVVAGHFDRFNDAAVKSPVRVLPDGTRDPGFAPKLSTEVPKPKKEPNATTSAYFKADGKEHYVACKGKDRTTTMIYVLQDDGFGHTPSCIVTYDGHTGQPGGAWQHCDARVKKLVAGGATCAETKDNPMHHGLGEGVKGK